MTIKHVRHGFGTVRPYVYSRLDTVDLLEKAFGAEELERHAGPNGFHIETRIGDGVIVLEAGDPPPPSGSPTSIYVYVSDVDECFRKAIQAGATPIAAPEDKPYQERAAGIRDGYGNVWWISTYVG
jgi:PhnB protein